MLSGDLDSTKKIELDNYREKIAKKKEDSLDNENSNVVKEKNPIKEIFNSFLSALYDLYKNFIGLFK